MTSENYYSTTRPAYTAFLPLYANYIIPPSHHKAAESRTAHLDLVGLLAPVEDDGSSKSITASTGGADPTAAFSEKIGLGRKRDVLSHAQKRIRLESIMAKFLDPLNDLLGTKRYFMSNTLPSSLDALALGYLCLVVEVKVPDSWAADILRDKYPNIAAWLKRETPHIFGNQPNRE
jgi:sorting and assembly machinery component 37